MEISNSLRNNMLRWENLPLAIDHWTAVNVVRLRISLRHSRGMIDSLQKRRVPSAFTKWLRHIGWINVLSSPGRIISGKRAQGSRATLPSFSALVTILVRAIRWIGSLAELGELCFLPVGIGKWFWVLSVGRVVIRRCHVLLRFTLRPVRWEWTLIEAGAKDNFWIKN